MILVGIMTLSIMFMMVKSSFDKNDNEKVAVGRFVDLETGETLAITLMDDDGTVYMLEGDDEELEKTWTAFKSGNELKIEY